MLFALCGLLMVSSCKEDDETNNTDSNPGTDPVEVVNGMATATFSGVVSPEGEGGLRGVTVTSGEQTTTTDLNGFYKLDRVKVENGRAVVRFQKKGFMSVVRSVPVQQAVRLDVSMKQGVTTQFAPATPALLSMWDGSSDNVKVQLPANAFVTESGAAYNGQVTAQYAYLDPDNYGFSDEMPGDLSALRSDNSEAQLVSYGMIGVELTDDAGNKLKLADGKTATLTFPVPEKFLGGELPASIPLWSFDETKGLWVEEGAATLTGGVYVGTVSHFSWHNLDMPELRATLKVNVLDANGKPVPGVKVNFDGQRTARTDNNGIATCTVPSNTNMVIWIPSEAYGNYAEVTDEYGWPDVDETKIVKMENVIVTPQGEKTITLQMPVKLPVISGKVTNEGSGTKLCLVWVEYGKSATSQYFTDSEGNFSFLAPNYTGPATFVAQYGDGYKVTKDITITQADLVVNLTANTNAVLTPGVLMVLGDGLNLRYTLPEYSDPMWDAVNVIEGKGLVMDAYLSSENQMEWGSVNINIPDYTGQSSFTSNQGTFHYMKEGMGGWTQVQSMPNVTIKVTKSGDKYTFKIENADAQYINPNLGFNWDNVALVKFSVEFSARKMAEENS